MRRFFPTTGCCIAVSIRCFYNERIFNEQNSASSLDNAKTALLQYNIMIDRGVKPDVLTFTSLIQTMAKARLEWQAYKLFSSMIDQGIEPLPETLLALRNATNPSRKRLIDDITSRIESVAETTPNTLSKEIEAVLAEGEADEQRRIDEVFRTSELPLNDVGTDGHIPSSTDNPFYESTIFEEDSRRETVSIDHPIHSWSVYNNVSSNTSKAQGDEAQLLKDNLEKLHEEELNIFLAIHKLLRGGTRSEMVDRIVSSLPSATIKGMLNRRNKYFRAVESVTETLLENRKAIEEDDNRRLLRGEPIEEIVTEHAPHESSREAFEGSADLLYTPWGAIRKPLTTLPSPQKTLVSKEMSSDALEEILLRVTSGETDQIPHQLLRQYAAHYNLSWKRFHPDSLLKAVQWHVENVLPSVLSKSKVPPTLAVKLRQQEVQGASSTIENYEAMRVIAKHTKNLQVTDGSEEINTSIRRAAAVSAREEERNEQRARKAEILRSADDLKRRATQYSPSDDRLDFGHVLQEKHRELKARASQVMVGPAVPYIGHAPDGEKNMTEKNEDLLRMPSAASKKRSEIEGLLPTTTTELPPWELDSASQPFNVDTGRFGDPTMGRYMELNDGRVKLMPQHESIDRHRSMSSLLPKRDREEILRHRAHSDELKSREEQKLAEKSENRFYRRYHSFVQRADQEVRSNKQAKSKSMGPILEEPRRTGYHLRVGKDKKKISSEKFQKFMRPT